MTALAWLVPIALVMGWVGLGAFLWSMSSGQYDDLDGAAERIFIDADADMPMVNTQEQATEPKPSRS